MTSTPTTRATNEFSALAEAVSLSKQDGSQNSVAGLLPGFSPRGADRTSGGGFAASSVPLALEAIALTGGFPGADVLPIPALIQAYTDALSAPGAGLHTLGYHSPFGTDELRSWIARDQGADFDSVVVTNGALHTVALVLEALINPGDLVIAEDPTYPFALRLFQYFGARLESVPVDEDGLNVEKLEALLIAGSRPKVLYLIPDFQNPTGVVLSAERRVRILELAEKYGFVVVSDNPYVRLRFAGEVVPDFDPKNPRVVHANTFSKILGPGLRLGWATAPAWLRDAIVRTRSNADQHSGLLTQRAVTRIVTDDALFASIINKAKVAYIERSKALYDGLISTLGERIQVRPAHGGLFLWAQVKGVDLRVTLDIARANGLDFNVGSGFDPTGESKYTDVARFAYSNAQPAELLLAAKRFADAVQKTPAA